MIVKETTDAYLKNVMEHLMEGDQLEWILKWIDDAILYTNSGVPLSEHHPGTGETIYY